MPEMPHRTGGYPLERIQRIADLQAGNYWFESRNRLIIWALQRFFPGARTLLEVGCGTGFVLQGLAHAFPSLRLTGADYLEAALDVARARVPGATFIHADAHTRLAGSADVVGAFDVLEHIPDDAGALREIAAHARPGGGVIVTVPQHPWLWSAADERVHHVRRYTRAELVAAVEASGLRVRYVTSFVALLLPVLALRRRLGTQRQDDSDVGDLRVGPVKNAALAAVLAAERALLRARVKFAAGGSLLLVAEKPVPQPARRALKT
jgi:SAM-dependent methyltransferase